MKYNLLLFFVILFGCLIGINMAYTCQSYDPLCDSSQCKSYSDFDSVSSIF